MAGSTISTTITNAVTLGSAPYASPLTITGAGEIDAKLFGVDIPATLMNGLVINNGSIIASQGVGVGLAAGSLNNAGHVYGLVEGVYMAAGSVTNSGSIGGSTYGLMAIGGIVTNAATGTITGKTIALKLKNTSLINDGHITGIGTGNGLYAAGGSIVNNGTISAAGIALEMAAGATVINSGSIETGIYTGPNNIGVYMLGGSLNNSGSIYGAHDGAYIKSGSLNNTGSIFSRTNGLRMNGGSLTNTGHIAGDRGLDVLSGDAVNSGVVTGDYLGIEVGSGTMFNAGKVSGGAGVGVYANLATFFNSGTVTGGGNGGIHQKTGIAVNLGSGEVTGSKIGVVEDGGNFTNDGSIYGAEIGLQLSNSGSLSVDAANAGRISGNSFGVQIYEFGKLGNSGSISGKIGADLIGGSLGNSGDIAGQSAGAELGTGTFEGTLTTAILNNSGMVSGAAYGVSLGGGTLVNSGGIYGETIGVFVSGGSLTNSGTIQGRKDAVYGLSIQLTVDPGAVFKGDVVNEDVGGKGVLQLGGTKSGALSGIGTKITGFTDIDFATGSKWKLSGNTAGLASAQVIDGFAAGDKIVLDGFAATSETYEAGIGLVLSSGTEKETLDIAGSFTTADFTLTSAAGDSTISLLGRRIPPGDVISGTVTTRQLLGGTYGSKLTVLATGAIKPPSPDQGVVVVNDGLNGAYPTVTIRNDGVILSDLGFGISAPHTGVDLKNTGSIIGLAGVQMATGTLINSGYILGIGTVPSNPKAGYYSRPHYSVRLGSGKLVNSGVIAGTLGVLAQGGGTVDLINSKAGEINGIDFHEAGKIANQGTVFNGISLGGTGQYSYTFITVANTGTILGGITANNRNYSSNLNAYEQWMISNTGEIAGANDGVSITGAALTNSGSISGSSIGVTLDSGGLINKAKGTISGGSIGVSVDHGSLTNAGVISGTDAVSGSYIYLTVDPGAVFKGDVLAQGAGNRLELAGTKAAALSGIGTSFSGFQTIGFESGSKWTVGGNTIGLAFGQVIDGFTLGDEIVLDGFTAMTETYVSDVGLVLDDAGITVTLDITGSLTTAQFSVRAAQGYTTIALKAAAQPAVPDMAFLRPANTGVALGGDAASGKAFLFADTPARNTRRRAICRSLQAWLPSSRPRQRRFPPCTDLACWA